MGKTLGRIAFEAFDPDEDDERFWQEISNDGVERWESAAAAFAAEVAAEWLAERGWRPIAEAPADAALFVGAWSEDAEWCDDWPLSLAEAVDKGYTHYLPQPDPPPQEPTR